MRPVVATTVTLRPNLSVLGLSMRVGQHRHGSGRWTILHRTTTHTQRGYKRTLEEHEHCGTRGEVTQVVHPREEPIMWTFRPVDRWRSLGTRVLRERPPRHTSGTGCPPRMSIQCVPSCTGCRRRVEEGDLHDRPNGPCDQVVAGGIPKGVGVQQVEQILLVGAADHGVPVRDPEIRVLGVLCPQL